MKKHLWLDEEVSVVGSISDLDDKIATKISSKNTTDNRIATRVISATCPDLFDSPRQCKLNRVLRG